jgi:transposase InsO family protein
MKYTDKKELVIRAFLNAVTRYSLPTGEIFHSNRESQYTSHAFMDTPKLYGIRRSFSQAGTPGDKTRGQSCAEKRMRPFPAFCQAGETS